MRVTLTATLPPDFYLRKTETVARSLLGQILLTQHSDGRMSSGRIVETEAYLGIEDPAAHSFGNRNTARIQSMYLSGGHAYVYFIYGMHFCFNVVTGPVGRPQAVLIRAIEPLEGIEMMRERRRVKKDRDLTNGPGKLCAALGIERKHDGLPLTQPPLWIQKGDRVPARKIVRAPRIGVDYAGEAAAWPLRFYIDGNLFVSRTVAKR
jgi:DNA-3-methyladenine glycosylase